MAAHKVQPLVKSTFMVIRYTFSAYVDSFFDGTPITGSP